MNFKAHLSGGILIGTGVVGAAVANQHFGTGTETQLTTLVLCFGTAVGFALFPDLDISSIPQRWFYRLVMVSLLVLGYHQEFELATLLGIIAITPVLDHHRGWTHNPLAAIFFPLILVGIYEYLLVQERWFAEWTLEGSWELVLRYRWLVIACTLGWWTHLLLDSKRLRRSPSKH